MDIFDLKDNEIFVCPLPDGEEILALLHSVVGETATVTLLARRERDSVFIAVPQQTLTFCPYVEVRRPV